MSLCYEITCIDCISLIEKSTRQRIRLPRSSLHLLNYLAVQRGVPVQRETIAEALWPDGDPRKMGSRLSSALHRLKTALSATELAGAVQVETDGSVQLCASNLCVQSIEIADEAEQFLADNAAMDIPQTVVAAVRAQSIFPGLYENWALHERVAVETIVEKVLRVLLDRQISMGFLAQAIETADLILTRDPLLEDIHAKLIDIYLSQNRPTKARLQLARAQAVIQQELGVDVTPDLVSRIDNHDLRSQNNTQMADVSAIRALLLESREKLRTVTTLLEATR